ncbi:MarR family winged helix-turn-helix transcriptional regulator [Leifsonia sp. AG29]|uniref:MarR family winged helix-turn-helix transcriptional regulator n=1 Tax=Leifsonia sp. AG29 TaxID=2598860 RepID=UPI001E367D90|nr:MarR family transcriptional regulator [Leifsonia sp. AG29]
MDAIPDETPAAAAAADPVDATIDAAGVLLRVAARSVQHVEDIVTSPQLRVLMLIELSGPQTLGGVAAELGVHASNATRTCEKLVQARLITRREDATDRRFVRLELTRKGRQLVERVIAERREAMADILRRVPAADRDTVARGFRLFADAAGVDPSRDGRFTLGPAPSAD